MDFCDLSPPCMDLPYTAVTSVERTRHHAQRQQRPRVATRALPLPAEGHLLLAAADAVANAVEDLSVVEGAVVLLGHLGDGEEVPASGGRTGRRSERSRFTRVRWSLLNSRTSTRAPHD